MPRTRAQTLTVVQDTASCWIVRHGERADVAEPSWALTAARPHDPPLTSLGMQQAAATAEGLKGQRVDIVYTSPFLRCVQTAQVIADALGVPLRIEPGLCEWLNADWYGEGSTPMDAAMGDSVLKGLVGHRLDMSYVPLWDTPDRSTSSMPANYRRVSFPETSEVAVERYESTLVHLREASPYCALVTHGYGVWSMAEWLLGRTVTEDCGYCCLTNARRGRNERGDEGWRCEVLAEESHLDALDVSAVAPLGVGSAGQS